MAFNLLCMGAAILTSRFSDLVHMLTTNQFHVHHKTLRKTDLTATGQCHRRHDQRRPSLSFGATWDGKGTNFAVFSANATKVEVCIFDGNGEKELRRIALPEYTDQIWHGYLPDMQPGTPYGYRVTARTSRRRDIASIRTSCCSIRMRARISASLPGIPRSSAIRWNRGTI